MNPFERPSNRVLVLFGATGDLAARKLFPGFFHLYREGLMPDDFRIIGSGRHSPGSDVQAKVPGPVIALGRVALTLNVDEAFDGADGLEAYERLLHDVMLRDRLLFTRSEQIERLWEVCAPLLENPPRTLQHEQGSWGPEAALELPGSPGWRLPHAD